MGDAVVEGLGARSGCVIVLYPWAKQFTLKVPIFTQEYKWVIMHLKRNYTLLIG